MPVSVEPHEVALCANMWFGIDGPGIEAYRLLKTANSFAIAILTGSCSGAKSASASAETFAKPDIAAGGYGADAPSVAPGPKTCVVTPGNEWSSSCEHTYVAAPHVAWTKPLLSSLGST